MSAKLSSPDNCTYLNVANVLLTISRNGDLKTKMYLTFYVEIKATDNLVNPSSIVQSLHFGIFV